MLRYVDTGVWTQVWGHRCVEHWEGQEVVFQARGRVTRNTARPSEHHTQPQAGCGHMPRGSVSVPSSTYRGVRTIPARVRHHPPREGPPPKPCAM